MKQKLTVLVLTTLAFAWLAEIGQAQRRGGVRTRSTPMRSSPMRSSPIRSAPRVSRPTRTRTFRTPTRSAPRRSTPTYRQPTRRAPTRSRTPSRSTPTYRQPTRVTPIRSTPTRRTPTRTTPTYRAPTRVTPTYRNPATRTNPTYRNPATRTNPTYRAPSRVTPRATTPTRTTPRPVRVRYTVRPTGRATRTTNLRDMYGRVPSRTTNRTTPTRTGTARTNPSRARTRTTPSRGSNLRAGTPSRSGSRTTPRVGAATPRVARRGTTRNPGSPRLGGSRTRGSDLRYRSGTANRVSGTRRSGATRTRTSRPSARLSGQSRLSPSGRRLGARRTSRFATSRYRYGNFRGNRFGWRHNHHLTGLLGLSWCFHLGYNRYHNFHRFYAYDPFYCNYAVGFGFHHYPWRARCFHPLNYNTWWYPDCNTYAPVTYIYVNDRGDYSPYPSTVVLNDLDDAPTVVRSDDVRGAKPVVEEKAEEDAETLVARHVTLGDFYFKEGRYSESAESYLRAIAYEPEDAGLHFVLADSLFALGDYHYAAFIIKKALKLDAALVHADADKRKFYKDVEVFKKQLAKLVKYTESKPYDDNALLVLGYNQRFSGANEAAKKTFAKLLEVSPDSTAGKLFLDALNSPEIPAPAGATPDTAGAKGTSEAPVKSEIAPGTVSPRKRADGAATGKKKVN